MCSAPKWRCGVEWPGCWGDCSRERARLQTEVQTRNKRWSFHHEAWCNSAVLRFISEVQAGVSVNSVEQGFLIPSSVDPRKHSSPVRSSCILTALLYYQLWWPGFGSHLMQRLTSSSSTCSSLAFVHVVDCVSCSTAPAYKVSVVKFAVCCSVKCSEICLLNIVQGVF